MRESSDAIWTIEQKRLQQWLALPKRERRPKTIDEFARELGADPATLHRWKKLDGFADEVRKLIRDCLGDELSEIYGALKREAKAGSYQHIKLALELVGDYTETTRQEVTVAKGYTKFTPDDWDNDTED